MVMTMRERRAVIRESASRYQRASKRDKHRLVRETARLTGYHPAYASFLLRNWERQFVRQGPEGPLVIIVGAPPAQKRRRRRSRHYDPSLLPKLIQLWRIADCLCGKRLAPLLKELIPQLERFDEIELTPKQRRLLLQISASTIDRLLIKERRKYDLKGRARTKPGTLLKHQIPIRTFAEWNKAKPGFCQTDLVAHDGGWADGDYCHTLTLTDVATTWTENWGVPNKAQRWVFETITLLRARLPFPLLGLDSDNGSEFINNHLNAYCQREKITFTRGRPYRTNDSCYVEQKNWSVVRRTVGYLRHDTPLELTLLNQIYDQLRLFVNFFQPSMKLLKKTRTGSQVKRVYDAPQTPFRRVLASEDIDAAVKQRLRRLYPTLNPAALRRTINRLANRLISIARTKTRRKPTTACIAVVPKLYSQRQKHSRSPDSFHEDSYVRQ